MKFFLISLILILNLSISNFAQATGPEYFSSKNWIEEKAHSPSPSQDVIYLGVITSQSGFLIPYRKTLKIQDLIAMTSYKQQVAGIIVMRSKNPIEPVFRVTSEPGSKINFVLEPSDVVWVVDPNAPEI